MGWSVLLLSRSQTLFYHETTAPSKDIKEPFVVCGDACDGDGIEKMKTMHTKDVTLGEG